MVDRKIHEFCGIDYGTAMRNSATDLDIRKLNYYKDQNSITCQNVQLTKCTEIQ